MQIKDKDIAYDDTDIVRAAECLKAMSNPLRLKILCVLGSNSISVQHIVEQVGTSQSNISQHLIILKNKKILGSKKDANKVYYFIEDIRMLKLIKMMRDVFCSNH
jgi:ArsR family transcriptional regulator